MAILSAVVGMVGYSESMMELRWGFYMEKKLVNYSEISWEEVLVTTQACNWGRKLDLLKVFGEVDWIANRMDGIGALKLGAQ